MFFQRAYEGRNAWWRWLLTIVLTITFWLLGHIPVVGFMEVMRRQLGLGDEAFLNGTFPEGVDRNLFLALALLPFAVAFFALWLLIRWIHRKPFLSVITGRDRFDWSRALVGLVIGLAVSVIGTFAILPADSYRWQFSPEHFWPLLAIALVLIPLQSATEEIFFRGYLMQGLSLILKNKIAPLIIVTLLFSLAHLGNPEFAATYSKVLVVYLLLSVLFGLCAVMDDGLEISCGLHASNNIFLALVLSPEDGSLPTYSLFTTRLAPTLKYSPWLDIALTVLIFGVLAVMYRWRFRTLIEPTTPPEALQPVQV
jgi:uncharacterized protein